MAYCTRFVNTAPVAPRSGVEISTFHLLGPQANRSLSDYRVYTVPSGPGQLSLAGLNLQRLLCASRRTPHYQLLRSFRPHPVLSARVVADRPAAACGAQSPAQSSSSLPVAGQLHARLAHRVAAVPHALLRPHSLSASRPSATAPANTALRGPVSTPLPQGERERERERERDGRVSPVPSCAVRRRRPSQSPQPPLSRRTPPRRQRVYLPCL